MYNQTPPRNNQEAFNRAWRFFVIDGHNQCRSTIRKCCAYRGDERGEACAVGCMLPSRMAIKADKYDSTSIGVIICQMPSVKKWFSGVDIGFLGYLQKAHDGGGFDEFKELALRRVAQKYGLKIPKC